MSSLSEFSQHDGCGGSGQRYLPIKEVRVWFRKMKIGSPRVGMVVMMEPMFCSMLKQISTHIKFPRPDPLVFSSWKIPSRCPTAWIITTYPAINPADRNAGSATNWSVIDPGFATSFFIRRLRSPIGQEQDCQDTPPLPQISLEVE